MPAVSQYSRRKYLSEVVKGVSLFEETTGNNFNFARVVAKAAVATNISTVGTILVWDAVDLRFEPLVDAMAIPDGGSTLPAGASVCIVCGPRSGLGMAPGVVTVDATGVEVSVLFTGDAVVVKEGLELAGISDATFNAVARQLNKQKIAVSSSAQKVTPSYI